MYVITPLRLNFKVNEEKHTIATAKQFKDPIILHGNVKAAVHESREQAMKLVLSQIYDMFSTWSKYCKTSPSDFELDYMSVEVEDGLFWSGPGCCSTHKFSDERPC